MTQGIYKIQNLNNNKVYIGRSRFISLRIYDHFCSLRGKSHYNLSLQNDHNNGDKFEHSILEEVSDSKQLVEREKYWIAHYEAENSEKGYNRPPNRGVPRDCWWRRNDTNLPINPTAHQGGPQ